MEERCARFREMSDMEYIAAVLNGDKDADVCFIGDFIEKICKQILRKRGPYEPTLQAVVTSEALSNDIYCYLKEHDWDALRTFKGTSQLNTYMYAVISRFLVRHYRSFLNTGQLLVKSLLPDEDDDFMDRIPDSTPWPDGKIEQNEREAKLVELHNVLLEEVLVPASKADLSQNEQRCIRLRYIANIPSREAAAILDMTINNVNVTTHNARTKIRNYFRAKGLLQDIQEVLNDE